MNVVESAILSTDLAMYFKKRDKFLELIDNGEFDWQSDEKKECEFAYDHVRYFMLITNFTFILFYFNSHFYIISAFWHAHDSL